METIALHIQDIVRIQSNDQFKNAEGIILDLTSDELPDEGPIAVYFGFGNRQNLFGFPDDEWKGKDPTPENYTDCPRVRFFKEEELVVIEDFSLGYKATLLYPGGFQFSLNKLTFPLEPGKYLCQLAYCTSDKPLATHKTIVNCLGNIQEIYTCETCHRKYHGTYGESPLALKKPLRVEISY